MIARIHLVHSIIGLQTQHQVAVDSACVSVYVLAAVHIRHRHLLLLLSVKACSWWLVVGSMSVIWWRVEAGVNCGSMKPWRCSINRRQSTSLSPTCITSVHALLLLHDYFHHTDTIIRTVNEKPTLKAYLSKTKRTIINLLVFVAFISGKI